MSRIMVTLFLQAKDPDTRQHIFDLLKPVAEHVWNSEPGTLRYCVCKPYEEDDNVSVYIIAEYKDKEAQQAHNNSPAAQKFINSVLSDKNDSVLASKPVLHTDQVTLSTGEVSSYTRPTINDYPEGYIILASVEYKPGLTTDALPGWKNIVAYCEANESLTLTYTILENKEENVIRTVEAYESKKYARESHVPGPAVKENQQQNGHMRAAAMAVKRGVKVVGFMGRP